MIDFESSEPILRARLLDAQQQLSAIRAAIAAKEVTRWEQDYIYQTALSRYSQALRRFSDLVVNGQQPH